MANKNGKGMCMHTICVYSMPLQKCQGFNSCTPSVVGERMSEKGLKYRDSGVNTAYVNSILFY